LHVVASRNNTILTFTNELGNTRAWVSAGRCGFKNVQRSGYEAGYQCAVQMFQKIAAEKATSHAPMKLEIAFKGFGFGREALYRALMTSEGDGIRDMVTVLKDTTPIKIGGTKAKKTRRL
ncbi:translational machinery component, partial [Ramaria rubella]